MGGQERMASLAARCYEPLLGRVLADLRTQLATCCVGVSAERGEQAEEGSGTVLDVCCGPGGLRPYLLKQGMAVVGIDLDAYMLREAWRRGNGQGAAPAGSLWAQADARQLPFASGCFDIAVVCLALHAMPWDTAVAVLGEMRRVAGRVVIADYCLAERNLALSGCAVAHAVEWLVGGEHYRCYREFMRQGALEGLLHSEGLAVRQRRHALGGAAMVAVV